MLGRTDSDWITGSILLLSVVAVFTDIRTRKIPNWLTFTGVFTGLGMAFYFSGSSGLLQGIAGAFAGLCVFLPAFALGWMGAGDVKLLVAFGVLGGTRYAINVALLSILVGGVLSILQLIARGRLFDFFRRFWSFLRSFLYRELEPQPFRADPSSTLPFAIPMAIAAVGRAFLQLPEVVRWP